MREFLFLLLQHPDQTIARLAEQLLVQWDHDTGTATGTQVRNGLQQTREDALRTFLAEYVERMGFKGSGTRYADGFIDLNGDGIVEAVVYLYGPDWCGTAGCTTLVLRRAGTSYRVLGQIPATSPPIGAMNEKAHGWRTLTATVPGGASYVGYGEAIPFAGARYRVSAARRLSGSPAGEVVIPADCLRNAKWLVPRHDSNR